MNRAFRMTCAAAFISLFLVLVAASAAAAGAAPQSDIESTGLNLANNDSGPTSSLLTDRTRRIAGDPGEGTRFYPDD